LVAGATQAPCIWIHTNVWIDRIDNDSHRHAWAIEQLQRGSERAPLHINLIVYTELLVPGPDVQALDQLLDIYNVLRSDLPWASAALAAAEVLDHHLGAAEAKCLAQTHGLAAPRRAELGGFHARALEKQGDAEGGLKIKDMTPLRPCPLLEFGATLRGGAKN